MEKVRKPIPERVRKMLADKVKTLWLTCSKCECEFEVTEGRYDKMLKEEMGQAYQCFDCLWKSGGTVGSSKSSTGRLDGEGHANAEQVEHKEE